jgi:hypothetical protein
VSEAEDMVRRPGCDSRPPTQPTSTKAFLWAVVTRISIDVLRSARVRRENYVGRGSPSRCLPIPARTGSGRRSWPARCRRRPCCLFGSIRGPARVVYLANDRSGVHHRTHVPERVGVLHRTDRLDLPVE